MSKQKFDVQIIYSMMTVHEIEANSIEEAYEIADRISTSEDLDGSDAEIEEVEVLDKNGERL